MNLESSIKQLGERATGLVVIAIEESGEIHIARKELPLTIALASGNSPNPLAPNAVLEAVSLLKKLTAQKRARGNKTQE